MKKVQKFGVVKILWRILLKNFNFHEQYFLQIRFFFEIIPNKHSPFVLIYSKNFKTIPEKRSKAWWWDAKRCRCCRSFNACFNSFFLPQSIVFFPSFYPSFVFIPVLNYVQVVDLWVTLNHLHDSHLSCNYPWQLVKRAIVKKKLFSRFFSVLAGGCFAS